MPYELKKDLGPKRKKELKRLRALLNASCLKFKEQPWARAVNNWKFMGLWPHFEGLK